MYKSSSNNFQPELLLNSEQKVQVYSFSPTLANVNVNGPPFVFNFISGVFYTLFQYNQQSPAQFPAV